MVENLLSKMYIEGALMSKSRNIAEIDKNTSEPLTLCTHQTRQPSSIMLGMMFPVDQDGLI